MATFSWLSCDLEGCSNSDQHQILSWAYGNLSRPGKNYFGSMVHQTLGVYLLSVVYGRILPNFKTKLKIPNNWTIIFVLPKEVKDIMGKFTEMNDNNCSHRDG